MDAVVFVLPNTLIQVTVLIGSLIFLVLSIDHYRTIKRHKKIVAEFEEATANFREWFLGDPEKEKDLK